MRIDVVTVAYNLPDATRRLIDTAVSKVGHFVHYHLFTHSTHEGVIEVASALGRRDDVTLYDYRENRGLSRSWNEGMIAAYAGGADTVAIINDDCALGEGDLDSMAIWARGMDSKPGIVSAWGYDARANEHKSLGYSCFILTPIALERVGCFDENIYPIYFEDNDYARRLALAGLAHVHLDRVTNVIHGGSSAIHADPELMIQNHKTFEANKAYYLRKWGGMPHHEQYEHPFNNAGLSEYIDPSARATPYGAAYDRVDRHIVRI